MTATMNKDEVKLELKIILEEHSGPISAPS